MLYCYKCNKEHDQDTAPDEGKCLHCNGPLVENKSEINAVRERVSDALFELNQRMKIARAKGRSTSGTN